MASTPTPAPDAVDVRSLAQIYQSGDLMLQNPAESCVIFVSVILVSALLEWVLQRAQNLENKYARLMAETMTQEITIVGVLALLLMFGTSVIPKDRVQDRYVLIFTWANMCLFFMAVFFVSTILLQFTVAIFSIRRWRMFEEGRMDAEDDDTLNFQERMYKHAFDVYAKVLRKHHRLTSSEIPFFEFNSLMIKKYLVKYSDLSYRTWLSLSIIVVANLARVKGTEQLKDSKDSTVFVDAYLYVGVIGFGTLFVFLVYFTLLQRRLFLFVYDRLDPKPAPTDAGILEPLGAPKRGIEFVQIITMSANWYVTLFITGLAKDISTLTTWQLTIITISFFTPVIIIFVLVPWTIMSITMLGTITTAGTSPETVDRLVRKIRGEYESDSDSDSDGDEESDKDEIVNSEHDEDAGTDTASKTGSLQVPVRAGSFARGSVLSGSDGRAGTMHSGATAHRPAWLEEDDYWDGDLTSAYPSKVKGNDRLNHIFYNNMDQEELLRVIKKKNPSLLQGPRSPSANSDPQGVPAQGGGGKGPQRPIWLDDDEDWDPNDGPK